MQIEKGIPLPEPHRTKKGESKYPVKQLGIGDSFTIDKDGHKSWAFVFNMITKAKDDHGIKLTTRLIDDNTRRVWRIA